MGAIRGLKSRPWLGRASFAPTKGSDRESSAGHVRQGDYVWGPSRPASATSPAVRQDQFCFRLRLSGVPTPVSRRWCRSASSGWSAFAADAHLSGQRPLARCLRRPMQTKAPTGDVRSFLASELEQEGARHEAPSIRPSRNARLRDGGL